MEEKTNETIIIRFCLKCGKQLTRNKHNSKTLKRGWSWESVNTFKIRKFCNHSCSNDYARGARKERKTVEKISGFRRTKVDLEVLARDNYRCTVCHEPKPQLIIYTTGSPSKDPSLKTNLSAKETLCQSCLMLTKVLPFHSFDRPIAKVDRNSQLISDYQSMNTRELARKYDISHQAVALIIRSAERRGIVDYSKLKRLRKRNAMAYADKFNPLKLL